MTPHFFTVSTLTFDTSGYDAPDKVSLNREECDQWWQNDQRSGGHQ